MTDDRLGRPDRNGPPPFRRTDEDPRRRWEEVSRKAAAAPRRWEEDPGYDREDRWAGRDEAYDEGRGGGTRRGRYRGEEAGYGDRRRYRDEDDWFRSPNRNRLYKNKADGKVTGVCAGLADYLGIDAWLVRLAVILSAIFVVPTIPVIVGYIILAVVLKPRPADLYDSPEEEVFWRSVNTKPDQTLAGIRAKFRDLDRQVAQMEKFIASREFDLHRQFKDLEGGR